MSIYEELGVREVINAATSLTRLGGTLMPQKVSAAMRQASSAFVDIHELNQAAGSRIAHLTKNEDAFVTAGCAAGLVVATLAFRTDGDLRRIALLPDDPSMPNEMIMHVCHRNPYDRAVELAGGTIRHIGNAKQTFDWELEAAINGRTAGVLYVAGPRMAEAALPLGKVTEIAHARGVPVVVDAAAQLPPVENLWHFTRIEGADLAVFSGGKELRGPQSSGLIVGSQKWIDAVRVNSAPHQRLARSMKVGKEELIGLLAAVELFVETDHAAIARQLKEKCGNWARQLSDIPGVTTFVEQINAGGAALPRLVLELDPNLLGKSARDIADELWSGEPGIAVLCPTSDRLCIELALLKPHQVDIVFQRLQMTLRRRRDDVNG